MLRVTYKIIHALNNLVTEYRCLYWSRLLLSGLAILVSSNIYASTVGTSVAITVEGSPILSPVAVGGGVEHDLGSGTKLFDVNPSNSTITLTSDSSPNLAEEWSVPQFEAVFSGGSLDQITSITRTGGTAANAANYSASASNKTVTFLLPPPGQAYNGTVIFTFTSTTPTPTITSATYSGTTGVIVVTGTKFTATGGANNDVIANKFTLTGEGGTTYTLTDTANTEIGSATTFSLTLSATDRAAINQIVNKNDTSSTGGTTYNLAGAAGFMADSAATADLAGNGITVSNVEAPTVTSATYDANTGVLVVTGTNLKKLNGAANDIVANKFTLLGQGNSTRTLTDTANVEIGSGTSFTLTLSSTDKAAVDSILNKNGTSALDATTYNLAAAEDWAAGADAVVAVADTTGNGITVSGVNAAPVIANLNGDSVAWPDVGNTVTLDAGGNATVTDIELDASNWNGASLTVQRINTPLALDVFSFNESGYSVSSGNLQTGGSTTFGTFTNANGVLAISFNANATNTLVRDVVRGIQYRNDTPAGDATIRFTLSDGNSSTTADVNVTTDFIYVTNATDTATINLVGGVSFSEAIAIAAADVTGSQTIVIASSLANQTVSTSAASTLNENLTLNLNSASGVTLSGGSLAIAPGVALTVTNGATDTTTFTTTLTGPGSFTKLGTGTLVLNGTSTTYTGSVTVGQGVLTVAHNNALGTTANGVTVSSGASLRVANGITITDALNLSGAGDNASGALQLASGAATVSGNINLSTTVVSINSAGVLSLSGIIGGTNLASTGTGSLILSGTNTYGNTTVSAGTLSVANDYNLGFTQITLASGTTLAVTGATTIDNGITLTGAATISNTANVTIDGVISGGHSLTKTGSGVLMLARDNTYAATNVDAGTLSVSSDSNLGSDAITLAAGTTLAINGATTIDNAIALTGAATISNAANATIDGVISGAHNLTKTGSATLTLAANNTYSGNTIVSAGGLTLIGGSSIGDGSAVSVASGATLTLGGGSETIGSLLGDGNIVLGYNLTTGGNNASTTFSGVISGTGNGITKTGSGTLTLSGTNTYTGSTTVSAGTLGLSGGAAISDTSAVTVSSGATLSLNASETLGSLAGAGNVSLNGFTLSSGDNNSSTTFSGGLIGSGGFAKTGSGTLTLSGSNSGTFTGDTTISSGGTLSVASDDNLGSGTLSINNSTLGITGATTIDNSIALTNGATISNTSAVTLSGAISGSGSLSKAGSGVLSLSGTSNYGGNTTVSAGTLSVAGALNGTAAVSVSSGATLTGSGSVTNLVVTNGGTLSPGNSPGVFTVNGNLQMNSGSTLAVEINGATAGTDYDQVIVNGTVSLAGNLVASHGYSAGQGDSYTIIANDMADAITGTFSGLAEGATITAGGNGTVLTASYIGSTGNDFTLTAPINAAPVVANLNGDSVSFIEDSDLVLLDANSDATVTDSDSTDFDGGNVTVSIINNRVNTEDVLSIRNEGTSGGQIGTSGLNITYGGTLIGTRTIDGGTDSNDLVINLNSAATPAIIQALVRNLTYINTNTTEPTTTIRSVEVTVNDGDGGTSSGAIIDVAVVAVNDAPTLTATGATPTFTEGGTAVGLFSGTTISTVESGQLITMFTVTVTNVTDGSDEVIHFDGTDIPLVNGFTDVSLIHGVDISVAVTGSTATLTFVRTGGLSSAQTLVNGMTYANLSIKPTVSNRVVTITSLKDDGGTSNGGVDTAILNMSATVTISAVNSAPVVTTTAGVTTFTEGNDVVATPVVIDADITVSDIDNATLASATVSITANFQAAEDVLAFINDGSTMGNISATYDAATGVLTLTSSGATATLAEWERALAAMTYTNSSETPSEATREISVVVNDGVDASVVSTKDVSVMAVNDTPIISGVPSLSINQGASYSFTPGVTDVDSVVFLFTITNRPSWAAFDSVTGTLSGTPTNADVGTTTGIIITVSDGTTSTNLSAFNLTVANVNDAPTVTSVPVTTATQDAAYSYILIGADVDVGDTKTLSAVTLPGWLVFNPATGVLGGTPTNADVGSHPVALKVTDAGGLSADQSFTITVANVNDAPVISGLPTTSVDQDVAYSFTPTATDVDAGSTLTYTIINKPSWASFNTATGALTGTPAHEHVGITTGIVITVSDGALSASLPAFNLEVIQTIDPLQPIVTAPADIEINATGLYTPVSLRQLLSLNPAATQAHVDGILAGLASDGVSGNTCCVTHPEGLNANNVLMLPPGRHEVTWTATNAADISGTATQVVDVRPLVSLSKSQIAIRGSTVEFRILLNGVSPTYPLDVPYVIDASSTASGSEHNLVNGVATFTAAGQVQVAVPVSVAAITGASDSQLVIALGAGINAGVAKTHTIRIREGNVPPTLSLRLSQGGVNTTQITPTGGPVTVSATVVDLNPGDTHSYDWSESDTALGDTDGDPVNSTLVFDPTGLTGRHQAQLTVTDSGGETANAQLYFRVVASLPVLQPDTDTDGDGINDIDEGYGDDNGNGIPDYLDNMPTSNVLPQQGQASKFYLIECDPGVRCGLGRFAMGGGSGGVQIMDGELGLIGEVSIDDRFAPVGGIFDFVIDDLSTPGETVRVVVPQVVAVPANAVYRKYQNGRWVSFIENANNSILSAPGDAGYCPPPGNPDWTPGLTEGHFCIQLAIEDGGPNDDDGRVNSAIVDPGAVSIALPVEPEPEPPKPVKPPVNVKSSGGGAVDGVWILLLGSLLMLKLANTHHRKVVAAVALLVTSVTSQASDLSIDSAYVRVDIYKVEGGLSEAQFSQSLSAAGHSFSVDHYDVNRRGYQIALGYQWYDYTYTEIGYLDLGDVKVDMTLAGDTNLAAFEYDLNKTYPVSAKGVTLVQGLTLFADQPVNVSLEGGVYVWRDDRKTNQQPINLKNDDGVAPLAGLRLDLALTKQASFGLSTRRIYLDDQVVSLYSLSGRYRF
jgi:autotransporter-associated beta strand protein